MRFDAACDLSRHSRRLSCRPVPGPRHKFGLDGLPRWQHVEFRVLRASGRTRLMAEERVQRRLAGILAADVAGVRNVAFVSPLS